MRQFKPGQLQTGSLYNISASYALTASSVSGTIPSSSYAITASFALSAATASYYQETDPVFVAKSGSFATTGSNTFKGNQTIDGNITVNGTASVALLYTTYQTSSIIYTSGSTKFGDTADDTHQFTGSLFVSIGSTLPVLDTSTYQLTYQDLLSVNWAINQLYRSDGFLYPNVVSLDWSAGKTYDANSIESIDWTLKTLSSQYGGTSLDWEGRNLIGTDGTTTVLNWDTKELISTGNRVSIDWENRELVGSDGLTHILNWNNTASAWFSGSVHGTASWARNAITSSYSLLSLSSSYTQTASYYAETDPVFVAKSGSFATTGSNIFKGNQTISGSNGKLIYAGTTSGVYPINTLAEIHTNDDNPWLEKFYNDTFSTSSAIMAYFGWNDGRFVFHNESTQSIGLQVNGFGAENGLLVYSDKVAFVNNVEVTGSLNVVGGITGSLFGTASWARNSITASHALTASYVNPLNQIVQITGSLVTTGSNTFVGTNTFIGTQIVTGSLFTTGSNTLIGNTILSGSLQIQGQYPPAAGSASVSIVGNTGLNGYLRFDPVTSNIDTSISASYIYVSGSTNDLYFSQNGSGYTNVTRLRWLEGNLYTGLLHGGVISQINSTTYQISSGSGIVVDLNNSFDDDPYPVVQFLNWGNLTNTITALSSSFDQQFVAISSSAGTAVITSQGIPYVNGDYNTIIPIGIVLHQNRTSINGVQTFPGVAYGWKQRSFDFIKAFGALKISGYTLTQSASSTRGLLLSGGTSWVDGRNYTVDPNQPSYIVEAVGTTTSKIFRYYQSGSSWQSNWGYNTNGGAGYTDIDPTQYSNAGTLTPVGSNKWTIQRVFYFPNSATKALFVYYGNAEYANEADALAAVTTETFTEAPNTAASSIYVGYMLLRNDANFNTPASYEFYAAGLFRGAGAGGSGGGGGASELSSLTDVSLLSLSNGDLLSYNGTTSVWNNTKILSGSYSVSGSLTAPSITGSLFGTASWASNATTASYVQLAQTASYVVTAQTASYVLQSVSSSFATTASYAVTSSYALQALSASYAPDTTFPYTGSAQITGSVVINNFLSTAVQVTANTGATTIYTLPTASYDGAWFEYTARSGSNARAGQITSIWSGSVVNFTETTTIDFGTTTDLAMGVFIVGSNMALTASATTPSWTIKTIIRSF